MRRGVYIWKAATISRYTADIPTVDHSNYAGNLETTNGFSYILRSPPLSIDISQAIFWIESSCHGYLSQLTNHESRPTETNLASWLLNLLSQLNAELCWILALAEERFSILAL
jgi:hypothetical protein